MNVYGTMYLIDIESLKVLFLEGRDGNKLGVIIAYFWYNESKLAIWSFLFPDLSRIFSGHNIYLLHLEALFWNVLEVENEPYNGWNGVHEVICFQGWYRSNSSSFLM